MNSRKQRRILILNLALAAVIISVTMFALEAGGEYKDVGRGIDIFGNVYNHVLQDYVKDVNPAKMTEQAIQGIMDNLDPYSVYMPPTDLTQLEEEATGEFGGLGIEIAVISDFPRVMSPPLPDTPAERVGLRAGDIIIAIDSVTTRGMDITEVVGKLRGQVNTAVSISVLRGANAEPMEFAITRAKITLRNISFAGEIQENVGYIKLNKFNNEVETELRTALADVTKNPNLKGVILDLRGNPGGLLTAARDVANAFLLKETLIVYTVGRDPSQKLNMYARQNPLLHPSIPLVVMVNERSASASEIVAGAIQDHDRGVLVGTTTFGKGLVQTVFEDLPDGAGLKLTTAYYYTPAGRNINNEHNLDADYIALQMDMEEGAAPDTTASADSLETREKFYTDNQRIVYGGGGVTPDLIVREDLLGHIVRQLLSQSVFFDYAVQFADTHPNLPENFEITDEIVADFQRFIREDPKFEYTIPGKSNLDTFRKAIEREKYDGEIMKMVDNLETTVANHRDKDFETNREMIKRLLKREIASAVFGAEVRTVASKEWDNQLRVGIDVLTTPGRYASLLSKGAKTGIVVTENMGR